MALARLRYYYCRRVISLLDHAKKRGPWVSPGPLSPNLEEDTTVDRQRLLFSQERQSSDSRHASSRLEIRGMKLFTAKSISCNYTMMNRAAFIEKLTEIQRTVERLLAQLQASEHDAFAAHLYQSRREYRSACDHSGKSGKQIERCLISTFKVAESIGFKGDFRQWEELLRIGN